MMKPFQVSFQTGAIVALCAIALAAPDIPNGCAYGMKPIVPGTTCENGEWSKK
jgi:hypothetical protein